MAGTGNGGLGKAVCLPCFGPSCPEAGFAACSLLPEGGKSQGLNAGFRQSSHSLPQSFQLQSGNDKDCPGLFCHRVLPA